ncbi:MAG: hypothetical protein GX112_11725, partial [Clostridiaceae bacterium]|nr:hypothetical protein [Clostridiaceae bacterium]
MGPKIRCLALFLVFTMIFIGVAGCASKGTSSQTLDPAGSSQPGPGASSGSQATHPVDPEPAVPTPGAGPGLAIPGALPEPPDGIGEPGKDFTVLQTGPADDWQGMAVPKFNPLGSQALYEDVQFLGDDVEPVPFYFLDGYTEKRETMLGERWELVIADPDYSLRWLRWYTREAGGQWYAGTQDHSTFTIKESDQVSWWADARQLDGKVEISVIKINTLPLSTWLTLRPGSLDSERFVFHTPPAAGGLQTATLKLAGPETCGVSLSVGSSSLRHGFEYETDLRFDPAQLMRQKTDTFILDDLPIAEGWLCWQLNWDQDTPVPDEITIRLDTVAAIEPVRWGAQPGAIRLTGIPPGGSATVQVPGWAQVTHRDAIISDRFLAGSVDNNGDMLFTAPAGYYLVGLPSGAGGDAIGMSLLRLVPVHAGEITTVIVPAAASVGAGALSRLYGDFEDNEGGVDLLAAQAD